MIKALAFLFLIAGSVLTGFAINRYKSKAQENWDAVKAWLLLIKIHFAFLVTLLLIVTIFYKLSFDPKSLIAVTIGFTWYLFLLVRFQELKEKGFISSQMLRHRKDAMWYIAVEGSLGFIIFSGIILSSYHT